MAYKASLASIAKGNGTATAYNIATLKYLATLATPITELVMRTAIEAGQFAALDNDDWLSFCQQLAAAEWEAASLTALELSVVNTLIEIANPDPSGYCSGVVVPTAVNTVMSMSPFVGSLTWQHSIDIKMDNDVDGNVFSIDVVLAGGPPATIPVTATAYFSHCATNGRHFSYLWTSYGADPTGITYTPTLSLYDADGVLIVSFALGGITL